MIPDEPNDQLEKRMHGIDERITIENLVFGTSISVRNSKKVLDLNLTSYPLLFLLELMFTFWHFDIKLFIPNLFM